MENGLCPRRLTWVGALAPYPESDSDWYDHNGRRTCAYCGSIHPDEFMERARAGAPLEGTDKSYKAYVQGGGKFYYQHLSVEQMREFVDLYNAKVLNFGRFGLYVLPFFMSRAPKVTP